MIDTTFCIFSLFVGVAGFEPTTPCSQSRCANRTALHPETVLSLKSGAKVVHFFGLTNFSDDFYMRVFAIWKTLRIFARGNGLRATSSRFQVQGSRFKVHAVSVILSEVDYTLMK